MENDNMEHLLFIILAKFPPETAEAVKYCTLAEELPYELY